MKLSNIRIERGVIVRDRIVKPQAMVICDMEAQFTTVSQLWFSVDDENFSTLTDDVYDAFLIAAIYPAMYYGENIEICGNVTKRLYINLVHYIVPIVHAYRPNYFIPQIRVQGFASARKADHLYVGTGFSGGVDSFSTLKDWFFDCKDEDYKISHLFFFHVGQYGDVSKQATWIRATNRYAITENFAKQIGLPSLIMNSNVFDFYIKQWEYDAGVLIRIMSVFVFQRILKRYYISNSVSYSSMMNYASSLETLGEFTDPYMMPLCSVDGLEIIHDGAQYTRSEKTARIANNVFAQTQLNVCIKSDDDNVINTMNCSSCGKCMRTQMALEAFGLQDKFDAVFDRTIYRRHAFLYKCEQVLIQNKNPFAADNIRAMKAHNRYVPPFFIAYFCVKFKHIIQRGSFIFNRVRLFKNIR